MYTQCKLQYESTDDSKQYIDTIYIPTKFAKKNQLIIVDKPTKRKAKVLEVFKSSVKEHVEDIRKTWHVGGL